MLRVGRCAKWCSQTTSQHSVIHSTKKLFVISDIHALDSRFIVQLASTAPKVSAGARGWLDYANRDAHDPLRTLRALIDREDIRADYIVCPGDVCDQANGDALRQAWTEIDDIRRATGADATIAATGNHDVDSRYRHHTYDPKDALRQLVPAFPVTDLTSHAQYWAYGVSEFAHGETRFVIVDSCAFHGLGHDTSSEIQHGRISNTALERLRAIVNEESTYRLNVLVCHHHVLPVANSSNDLDDRMIRGDHLLEILDESPDHWLLIHGHRHAGKLTYSSGNNKSASILSAGSAAVRLDPALATHFRNQVHLVEVAAAKIAGGGIRGTVRTWDYIPYSGWEKASGGGLPANCGFGYRGDTAILAQQIASVVTSYGGPVGWTELCSHCTEIRFLTPGAIKQLTRELRKYHRIGLSEISNSEFEAAEI